ncbi:MAG: type III restriction endonuclease subunit R, partial [Candidatus Paceibacteria bacterium]
MFEQELKGRAAEKEKKGWEHTVIEYVLKKFDPYKRVYSQENTNVLLEFTATIPKDKQIAEKYQDKIVYTFDLKDFLQAGYTKEINLISSSLDKRKRILQALLFQWYRHKIALKYHPNFKPVVLFRSKYADQDKEENSFADKEYFLDLVHNVSGADLEFLTSVSKQISQGQNLFEQGRSRTQRVLKFIEENEISFGEIADWIRQHYQERNIIVTNSQTKKSEETDAETEQLLNSLEDPNNHIRAIFTVKRLTEGWDVLNLFDIVRLYEGRDEGTDKSGKRKAGDSTIA